MDELHRCVLADEADGFHLTKEFLRRHTFSAWFGQNLHMLGGRSSAEARTLRTQLQACQQAAERAEKHEDPREMLLQLGIILFGFPNDAERQAYRLLQTISGVGPRMASDILSRLTVPELVDIVATGNVGRLRAIPYIGERLAEAICTGLRDKIASLLATGVFPHVGGAGYHGGIGAGIPLRSALVAQVVATLVQIGYRRSRAAHAARSSGADLPDTASMEALLRAAMVNLARDEEGVNETDE